MSRGCNELGVCQHRKPACVGCTAQFAPDVIQGPYTRRQHFLSRHAAAAIGKWLLAAAGLAAVSLVIGFGAGYLSAGGLFP